MISRKFHSRVVNRMADMMQGGYYHPKPTPANEMFKGGTGDKLLFSVAASKSLKLVSRDAVPFTSRLARNTLEFYYSPEYSWWDERLLAAAKKMTGGGR